eukprot:TRINITY_DN8366_c0_g1_i3.p1 TRINITY_DN8366_c0_g1~~TRINITY_DN8366_c0_g1_i3.p1  ORF type:complete len:639 (-),score=163.75 TRINITY_DN8366_c0_g1_i3:10-1926(-)
MAQSVVADIQQSQRDVIVRMLNFNEEDKNDSGDLVWKILVYDRHCQDILAPLINVGDLRKLGVTLHLLLEKDREAIGDTPAIYFVSPTEENIERICRDLAANMYESFHLNFATSLPRPLLEKLAMTTVQQQTTQKISKVYDQYCSFMSLEPQLLTLNMTNSYEIINNPSTPEAALVNFVQTVVDSLFGVCVTLGAVPIIRCAGGGSAEMVATQLDERLRHHLSSKNNLFAARPDAPLLQRPLLVLFDRNVDLSVALHHTWTYQALVHDLLHMKSNRVKVPELKDESESKEDANAAKKFKSYDLDRTDEFWTRNAGKPFPQVAEEVDALSKEYQREINEIKRKTGLSQDADISSMAGQTAGLASVIESLPALQEKKRRLDFHVKLASAILQQLQARELDNYFSLEENLMIRSSPDRDAILAQIGPGSKGTAEDKMRLFLIYFLTNQLDNADLEVFEKALTECGADMAPLNYVKQLKLVANISTSQSSSSSSRGLLDNILDRGAGFLAGVKNILPSSTDLPVTKIVDSLLEGQGTHAEQYLYFDPKIPKRGKGKGVGAGIRPPAAGQGQGNQPNSFRDAIVFMLGGGNYVEFQNLQDYANKNRAAPGGKSIAYGVTEVMSPGDFLAQLHNLGSAQPNNRN